MLKQIKSNIKDWASKNRKITMCKKCYTFYYKKSWHFDKPQFFDSVDDKEIPVKFTECPACLEQENSLYEMESVPVWRAERGR